MKVATPFEVASRLAGAARGHVAGWLFVANALLVVVTWLALGSALPSSLTMLAFAAVDLLVGACLARGNGSWEPLARVRIVVSAVMVPFVPGTLTRLELAAPLLAWALLLWRDPGKWRIRAGVALYARVDADELKQLDPFAEVGVAWPSEQATITITDHPAVSQPNLDEALARHASFARRAARGAKHESPDRNERCLMSG
jgi:hypothetical protein